MNQSSRYLDSESKEDILQDLQKQYDSAKNDDTNDGLDISIIPLLKKLNIVEGIVTLQSCAGHSRESEENGVITTYYDNACLWIWPSEEMAKKFYEEAYRLAGCPGLERLWTLYSSWGQEIIEISFAGCIKEECDSKPYREGNHERIKEHILSFFKSLEATK